MDLMTHMSTLPQSGIWHSMVHTGLSKDVGATLNRLVNHFPPYWLAFFGRGQFWATPLFQSGHQNGSMTSQLGFWELSRHGWFSVTTFALWKQPLSRCMLEPMLDYMTPTIIVFRSIPPEGTLTSSTGANWFCQNQAHTWKAHALNVMIATDSYNDERGWLCRGPSPTITAADSSVCNKHIISIQPIA